MIQLFFNNLILLKYQIPRLNIQEMRISIILVPQTVSAMKNKNPPQKLILDNL